MKTYLFYIKTTTKSALFLFTLLFISFLTYKVYGAINISVSYFTAVYVYSIICFNLFLVTTSTYIMLNRSNILRFLERDILKKQYSLIVSCTVITLFTASFPILLMFFFKNDLTQPIFLLKGITHFLIIWLLSNILAVVIGSSISLLVRNKFSYLFSLLVYGWFVWMSMNLPIKPINRYLNIFDDNTYTLSNNISGPLFNMNYFLDKLFLILVIFLFIFLVRSFVASKMRVINFLILGVLIISVCLLPIWSNSKYLSDSIQTNQNVKNTYEIQKYNMNLELTNKLKNKVTMLINFPKDSKDITLALDNIFVIKNLKINNNSVSFTNKNDVVTIHSSHKQGDTITLTMEYEGTVDVVNNIGVNTYYVTKSAINLPGYFFDWYPNIKGQSSIDFNISVDATTKIYSNIPSVSSNEKHLVGSSNSLNIFAGQYQQVQVDKIQYIIPISYNFDGFKSNFESLVNNISENTNLSKDDLLIIKNKNYTRVIVGVWPFDISSNPVQVIGDTILVNYNQ